MKGFFGLLLGHVRVHVRDEQIQQSILVVIKEFYPHRAPGSLGKVCGCLLGKAFAAEVFVVMIVALHVEEVKIGKTVLVQVGESGIATPGTITQVHLFGNVFEMSAADVLVEDAELGSLRIQVAIEGIGHRQVITTAAFLIGGVNPDVGQQQVQQPVVVEVKEYRARGVTDVVQARFPGDVREAAVAEVSEQMVAMPDSRHKKVRRAVVVNVGKRRRHRDLIRQGDPGLVGDLLELSAAQISPELVPAQLGRKINIQPAVSIDIGHRKPVSVVVVSRLIRLAGVVHDLVLKPNPARVNPIGELKIVEGLPLLGRRFLLTLATLEILPRHR